MKFDIPADISNITMSSSVAGKFQDHYALLAIEPTADSETIQAAYAKLAQKYHPDNTETGDKTKFDAANQAYEVLSDPGLRAAFDQVKGVDREGGKPKFTGAEFFEALEQSAGLRAAILCILYDRRRVKSFKPSLSMRHLDAMVHVTGEALNFALWYLKKRSFVIYDDKSAMEITVEGMDFLEQNRPSPELVMPFIRPDSLATPWVGKQPAAAAKIAEPVLNVLSRALQRNNPSETKLRS
jgi:hypothetical protein